MVNREKLVKIGPIQDFGEKCIVQNGSSNSSSMWDPIKTNKVSIFKQKLKSQPPTLMKVQIKTYKRNSTEAVPWFQCSLW